MLPSTDRYAKTSVPPRGDSVEPHFFVVLEGSRPAAGGLRCSLRDVDEVVLGRGDARSVARESGSRRLTLTLPDSTVSARHARLLRQQDGWVVEDAGSTNGTFVNGRQVFRQALDDGDCLGIGQSIMRLRVALPTPQGTPSFTDPAGARDPVLDLATLLPAIAVQDALIARVALSALPVLLLGDTGTGKEVMARAIHAASKRTGAFVALNCGALPDSLIESQLFGHVKGAFSGAARDTIGFVRAAHGGTLFLDEIGDLPYPAQGALLRVLQEGEVVPVGAMRPAAVDVRVIAATHRPIVTMVERGEFRRDLFARLQGFTYKLLPLVERSEDIGLFVADHLRRLAPARASSVLLSPEAALALVRYPWPHNIRELVHVLTHALVLGQEAEVLGLAHLPPAVAAAGRMVSPETSPAVSLAPADAALRAELVDHLGRHKGNVTAVARAMRKAPMQIYRWMQRLGVDPDAFR